MERLDLTKYCWQTVLLRVVMLGGSACLTLFALYQLFSFTPKRLVVLGVSMFVSLIVCRYSSRLPGTRIIFSAKYIFAFWGIMWLGVAGGILLAASATITEYIATRENRRLHWVSVSVDIFSAFASGLMFYLVSGYLVSAGLYANAGQSFIPAGGVPATIAMVLTHYLLSSALVFLLKRTDDGLDLQLLLIKRFGFPAVSHLISLAATVVLFAAFRQFGIEFGLVLLPISIIGDLAYRIHLRRLGQKTRQITEASRLHLATVEALATAIDARDQVGMGHVRRTQLLAVRLGTIMGLAEPEINALRAGALLHDIGKLAVPDHILNKPGKLSPEEMEKTKIHPLVGAAILESVGFEYPVVPTVKYHHERWDGAGYPERLKGEEIPVTARILSVADAYDALRSARPYRSAVSRDEARDFLVSGAGLQFDPTIVSILLRNLARLEAEIEAQGLGYSSEEMIGQTSLAGFSVANDDSYVEQIKRANREVFTLYELAREFSSSADLQETLDLFSEKIAEFVPFDTCAVYILDESGETATTVTVNGKNQELLKGLRIRLGEGATGEVLNTRKSTRNTDPSKDLAIFRLEVFPEYISMISLPLVAEDKLIGAVTLYSSALSRYTAEDQRLLETISRIASDAIHKSLKHAEAERYALTDPMTGLPNARSLQAQFEREAARADRGGTGFQVLMLDLDGFKAVNDSYGHKAGDRMLREIAKIIRGQLRDYDFLARYAGDEFVAIIPETNSRDVRELCRRIDLAVNDFTLVVGDETTSVGVSIGAAGYPEGGDTFDQLIAAADKAMYAAKSDRKVWEKRPIPKPDVNLPETQPKAGVESAITESDNLILEVDETHIISAAVN